MKKRELLGRIEALERQVADLQARLASTEGRLPLWYPWWSIIPPVTTEPNTIPWMRGTGTADPMPESPIITCETMDLPGTMNYQYRGAFPDFDTAVSRVMSENAELFRELADA